MKTENSKHLVTPERYVDIKAVSRYTSLAESTLYEWSAQGRIPSIKIGRRVLFDLNDIDQVLASLKRSDSHKKVIDKIVGEIIDNGYNSIR
jgi:excisionase family DNA binding protein|tara:strand:+ start:140 stop:412 length:273 start_codon:yes stop_codon:yes gene_type:complete